MADQPETISFDEFLRIKMRVARVLEASDHPGADKLLVLKVDLGGEQRQVVAGIKGHYEPSQLIGRNIIIVTNLAARKMRGCESQGMLLAATSADRKRVILLTTAEDIEPGSAVS